MRAKSAEEIAGLEFDWLAHDADGHVGLFSTAGGGYAPEEFLQDTEAFDEAIELILSLPGSTTARFAPELAPGLRNTWRLAAERGLFAFDADANGGPYHLVAAPAEPVRISELRSPAEEVVRRLGLRHIRFATSSVLSKEMLAAGSRGRIQ